MIEYDSIGTPHTLIKLGLIVPLLIIGCGKRRPPLPPIEHVPQRTELLSGTQRGNQVILTWPAPHRNASDSAVQSIRRIDVYRLAERAGAPRPLTEEEFDAQSTLIGSVSYEQLLKSPNTLSYVDNLSLIRPVRLTYAVRYVNAEGQRAGFSNFLSLEPGSAVSEAPVITRIAESEHALTVRWQAPGRNVDGSSPANVLGYNVYRTTGLPDASQTLLNQNPVTALSYSDQSFRFGEDYTYIVRAISPGANGSSVESLDSNTMRVSPRDIYPPSPPKGLTAVASDPHRIVLFFAANPEPDVAGYNLYRSTDPALPKEHWKKLNASLLVRTNYQDDDVQGNTTYYYYLTAVDSAGNTSKPSEVISESVR